MIDIKLLSNISNIKNFEADSIIISELDKEYAEMFIILSGKVKAIKNYGTANEIILGEISIGDIFGEISLFSNIPRSATIIAQEPTTVASITKRNFLELSKKNSELVFQLLETLSNRVVKSNNTMSRINADRANIFKRYNINEAQYNRTLLFPEEHGHCGLPMDSNISRFTTRDNFTCPHCAKEFVGYVARISALRPKSPPTCDMRSVYYDFDPVWYEIITCPHCYFSAFQLNFTNEVELNTDAFEENLAYIKTHLKVDLSEPKDSEQVFATHYLALICAPAFNNHKILASKIWLSLSWLYNDGHHPDMEIIAMETAYKYTNEYYNEYTLSPVGEQLTLMILGSLARKLGRLEAAYHHLLASRQIKDGKPSYNKIAEHEIYDLRGERQALPKKED